MFRKPEISKMIFRKISGAIRNSGTTFRKFPFYEKKIVPEIVPEFRFSGTFSIMEMEKISGSFPYVNRNPEFRWKSYAENFLKVNFDEFSDSKRKFIFCLKVSGKQIISYLNDVFLYVIYKQTFKCEVGWVFSIQETTVQCLLFSLWNVLQKSLYPCLQKVNCSFSDQVLQQNSIQIKDFAN